MGEKDTARSPKRFNGSAWFERQVHTRTRAALTARGIRASTRSRVYQLEYAWQLSQFRSERAEKKRQK